MLLRKVHQERDLPQGKAGLQGHGWSIYKSGVKKPPIGQILFVLPGMYWCQLKILVYAHIEKVDPCQPLTLYVF